MKLDGIHYVASVHEERLLREAADERAAIGVALRELVELATDREAAGERMMTIDAAEGQIAYLAVACAHARLVRALPYLADVLAFLCWPESYGVIESLDAGGLPFPSMEPPGGIARVRGES